MKYTLHQLEVFQCLVETSSISKTAKILNLTQPAVSIQMRNFQNQFDLKLYEMIGRRIYITEFGRKIAAATSNIINQVEQINFISSEYQGRLASKLKISVVSTGKYVMPFFLKDFLSLHPSVELVLDVTNKAKVLESLENNEVDFALVSILPEKLKVESIPLLKNKLYLVGHESFEIQTNLLQPKDLENFPIILRETGSGTRETMERFFYRNEVQLSKPLVLTSNEAVKQAIVAGLGASIMPIIGLKNEINLKQLKIIPCKGLPIETQWSLIWMKGKALNPTGLAFKSYLEQNKNAIIQRHFNWM